MKLDLPIHQQTRPYTCLPACIKMVLGFIGIEMAEDEIAQACKTTGAGTLPRNAVAGIRTIGHQALAFEDGTLEYVDPELAREVALEAKIFLTAWHSLGGEGLLVWAKSPNSQNA